MSSQVIDEKVVEMRFQNSQFEKGVKESMSTIDKLKASLNFSGASKSFNQITEAANRVSFKGLERNVDELHNYINMKSVAMFTVVSNMVSQIQSSISNMMKQFTTVPISTGFQEYELKMGSVQTIMAATGESLETVNKYLQELNEYSDKTIYSFSDMTQNIGKFTNAGVKLEDAVLAMKGISNEAAISGANANEASRAMYNLAQSLSMGYVQYIDWKSIENANMATVQFKQNLTDVAVQLGVVKKSSDGYYEVAGKSYNLQQLFKDALKDQWLTTDVLIKTLRDYADETTEIGKKAYAAAQDVKTFTMMMDTLKEAAQSGWAYTWEIFIGDFEEAKKMFTEFSQMFGKMIDDSAEARNSLLRGVLGSKWDQLISHINAAGIATDEFEGRLTRVLRDAGFPVDEMVKKWGSLGEAIRHMGDVKDYVIKVIQSFTTPIVDTGEAVGAVTGKLEDFQKVVNQVIRGEFGNGADRVKRLSDAGWEYAQVQGLVNKVWKKNNHTWKDTTITMDDLVEVLGEMSTKELEQVGITEEQVKAFQELQEQAALSGTNLNELIGNLYKPSGRELIFDSIHNAVIALTSRIGLFKEAWKEVFPQKTTEELYGILEALNKFTKALLLNDKKSRDLKNTFKGLFSILGLVVDTIQAFLQVVLPDSAKGLGDLEGGILSVTGSIGEAIYNFREFVKENGILVSAIQSGIDILKKWIDEFFKLPIVTQAIDKVKKAIESFVTMCKNLFAELKWEIQQDTEDGFVTPISVLSMLGKLLEKISNKLKEITDGIPFLKKMKESFSDLLDTFKFDGENVVDGFINGINSSIKKAVNKITELAKSIVDAFKDFMGIHSPSTTFFELAKFCMEGLALGFRTYSTIPETYVSKSMKPILDRVVTELDSVKKEIIKKERIDSIKNFLRTAIPKLIEYLKIAVEKIKGYLEKLKDYIERNGYEVVPKILKIVDALLGILLTLKAISMVGNISKASEKIGEAFENIAEGISGFFKSMKYKNLSSIVRNFAVSIAVLIGVIAYIGKNLTPEEIDRAWEAVAMVNDLIVILGAMMIIMVSVTNATAGLSFYSSGLSKSISSVALLVLSVAASLAIISKTIQFMGTTDEDVMKKGIDAMMVLLHELMNFAVVMGMVSVLGRGNLRGVAMAILGMILGIKLILDIVYKYFFETFYNKNGELIARVFKEQEVKKIQKAFESLAVIIFTMAGALAVIGLVSHGVRYTGVALSFISMAAAIWIIVKVVDEIDTMLTFDAHMVGSLMILVGIFIAMGLVLTVLIDLAQIAKPGTLTAVSGIILSFGLMCLIISKALKDLNKVDIDDGAAAVMLGVIVALLLSLGFAVLALVQISEQKVLTASAVINSMSKLLLAMSVTLAIIAKLIKMYDIWLILEATGVMVLIAVALTKLVQSLGAMAVANTAGVGMLFGLAAGIAALAGSIFLLQDIDLDRIALTATILGGVVGVLEWASKFITAGWEGALVIVALAVSLGIVGAVLKDMSSLPFNKLIQGITNLIGVIVTTAAAMFLFLGIASIFSTILLPAAAAIAAVAFALLAVSVAAELLADGDNILSKFFREPQEAIKDLIDWIEKLCEALVTLGGAWDPAEHVLDAYNQITGKNKGGGGRGTYKSGVDRLASYLEKKINELPAALSRNKNITTALGSSVTVGFGTETKRYSGPNQIEVHTLTQQSAEAGKQANEAMTDELTKPVPASKAEEFLQSYIQPFLESTDGATGSWMTYMKDSFGKLAQGTKIDPSDWSSFFNIEGIEYNEETKKMIEMLSGGMENADWSKMSDVFSTYMNNPEMAKMFEAAGINAGGLFAGSFLTENQKKFEEAKDKLSELSEGLFGSYVGSKISGLVTDTIVPVISPSLAPAAGSMGDLTSFLGNMTAGGFNAVQFPETMNTTSPDVVNAVNALHQDIQTLYVKIANLQVRLDTGALVGTLTPQINQSMGKMAVYKVRGN